MKEEIILAARKKSMVIRLYSEDIVWNVFIIKVK